MVGGCDSDIRPAAHSPRSSPNVSPTHSYSAGSVGSSSSSTTNGFISNGTCIDNGFDADNMPMEVEDFEELSNHGVLNGTANMDDSDHSSSRGTYNSKLDVHYSIIFLTKKRFKEIEIHNVQISNKVQKMYSI